MNPTFANPGAWERRLLAIAIVAVVAAAVLAWFFPTDFFPIYRFVLFASLAPALGSLLFFLIHRLTGGRWGDSLQPFFAAGIILLPWIWLAALPLPLLGRAWPVHATGLGYDSRPMVELRAVIFGAVFFALSFGTVPRRGRARGIPSWLPPLGLVGLVFMLHLLADDWLAGLEPDWHSTAFPAVWMTGSAVSGLSLAVLLGVILTRPAIAGGPRPLGIEWGNMLLASTIFWCYLTFMQFLIIWSGNLPREISWFQTRLHPAGKAAVAFLLVFHFLLPFFALLSRKNKQSRGALLTITVMLLFAQIVYLGWVILPGRLTISVGAAALTGTLLVAAAGFFVHRYILLARLERTA